MKKIACMMVICLLYVGTVSAQDTTRRNSRMRGTSGVDTTRTDTSRNKPGGIGTIKRDTLRRK